MKDLSQILKTAKGAPFLREQVKGASIGARILDDLIKGGSAAGHIQVQGDEGFEQKIASAPRQGAADAAARFGLSLKE